MDIRCPFCGEPWEHDSLHDMPEGPYKTPYDRQANRNPGYERASAAFRRYGCGFFDHAWQGKPLAPCPRRPHDAAAAETAAMAYAALGGDLDAAASLLDDLG